MRKPTLTAALASIATTLLLGLPVGAEEAEEPPAEAPAASEAPPAEEAAEAPPAAEPAAEPPAEEELLPVPGEEAEPAAEEAEEASPGGGERAPDEGVGRVLTTATEEVRPGFLVWEDERFGARIKPIVQVATGLVLYVPYSSTNPDLAMRASTLLLSRFGIEGELFDFIAFRVAFERNVGFSLARGGPIGTSVWEGTASMQSVENWVRLQRWGLALTGGVIVDPASVDYISANVLDFLGKDPYIRDPLLVSGFNQGQGVMLRYTWRGLSVGVSYTGGNPLTSSLSFGFGGNVGSSGSLYSTPLRAFSNGLPGSDVQMNVVSPSVSFENDMVGVRVTGQFYFIDVDATSEDDRSLFGYNLRATAQLTVFDGMLRFFAGGAYRQNEQLDIPDLTTYRDEAYQGWVVDGGLDFTWGPFSIGGTYYYLRSEPSSLSTISTHYINVGATYWLVPTHASVGLRWGRTMNVTQAEGADDLELVTDSAILSLRLLI